MTNETTPAPLPPVPAGHPHAVREALEAARHALTTLQNLYVTDKPHAYEDAMRDGEDANGARDEQREASWFIDEAPVLATIDAALLALDGRDAGRDAEDAARWRGLMSCDRIRILGSASTHYPVGRGHMGVEFTGAAKGGPDDTWSREQFTQFADGLARAASAGGAGRAK